MLEGLQRSGCNIISTPRPDRAPFVITFETRTGERMGVVAYAFRATRTPARNRPEDERSFQVKYGSKDDYADDNAHVLWQDQLGLFTTLLIGIDIDEKFFVAADPVLHSPTKFFIRLEFKDEHAAQIKLNRWHSWERERRAARTTGPTESLVGGTVERILDLIRFERAALGLDPGHRQLMAEKPHLFRRHGDESRPAPLKVSELHPLANELGLGERQILGVIAGARRLKMAVRGWVAEEHLRDQLARLRGVQCERLDAEGGPDVRVRFEGGRPLTVECKNVLRRTDAKGRPRMDFQRTRAAKSDPCSRYYAPDDFDVVAACLHAVTEKWEFRYIVPGRLSPHANCAGKLGSNVVVGSDWSDDPREVFRVLNARGDR
jgi:hypothetical protein